MFGKPYLNALLWLILACVYSYEAQARVGAVYDHQKLFFIENKGQIKDQRSIPRKDVQFSLQGEGVNIFIGDGQLHYQFFNTKVCSGPDKFPLQQLSGKSKIFLKNKQGANTPPPDIETYRMDVELVGANKNATVLRDGALSYYENYFLPGSPANGIQALTYGSITYKNIYPFIDWVLYIKNNKLEYDFIINPGGNVKDIKIRYNGVTDVVCTDDHIIVKTPYGEITERNLKAYCRSSGKPIAAIFKLKDNTLSFSLHGAHKLGKDNDAIVIDPVLEWGTYYGPDTSASPLYATASDYNANIYTCGMTFAASYDNIATTGSYQSTYSGDEDAYLVKFDSSGHRLWATYFGGSGQDWGQALSCDHFGNVYMGGFTGSVDSIATPGCHQPALGGVNATNGFLAKFNSSGQRIWATYYGGNQSDEISSVICDDNLNVYIAGSATSSFNIATPGSFEPTFVNPGTQYVAGFLAQFDTAGVRNWGTYYEAYIGPTIDNVYSFQACTDGIDVFVSAWADGPDSVTTPGSWQPVFGGVTDAFVAKFNNLGNRIWATFYGGPQQEVTGSIACDKTGYVYLLGATSSDAAIASPGCAQPLRAGAADAFLVQFDPVTGMRNWGTYYGGPANENVNSSIIATNEAGSVYIVGGTESLTGIASAGAWQTTYGGGDLDAFLAEYDPSGAQLWSTYYGGTGTDIACACAFDGRNVYICGLTNSPNNIATPGSFDSTCNGDSLYNKGFLAKFAPPGPGPILGPDSLCTGTSITLSDNYHGGTWSSSDTSLATIDTFTGLLSVIAPGMDTVTYMLANGNFATITLFIQTSPDAIIGSSYICFDSATTFYDSTGGGFWSSSNTSVATIGSSTGVVTGSDLGGTVIISYTVPNGCSAIIKDTVSYCWPAGITSISNNFTQIYPNPAVTEFAVISTDKINTISIISVTGQTIYYNCCYISESPIDINYIIPGIYFIKLNGIIIGKLVKSNGY